ncbi:MAG TPA: hypothetical protein VNU71_16335 [Burkholderiaceae bacterium]|nr:hypothetical protein [Burkholderiaceae bacterium]
MASGTIPIKTAQGQAELAGRERRVGQRHRTVLFLVDGRRPTDEVLALAAQAGVPEACFDELVRLGLIALTEAASEAPASAQWPDTPLLDPALTMADDVSTIAADSSLLPPARTMYPSVANDSALGPATTPSGFRPSGPAGDDAHDPIADQVRAILIRAVRAEAPLAGSLTLLKLRRARNRADLFKLLDEVEARIMKPHRSLAAGQMMRRVRHLLARRADSTLASA